MLRIVTDKPVAVDSPDHLFPHGTALNNTVNEAFNQRLYQLIPAAEVRLLDLGCAGGGFVKSVIDAGGMAVGIDGSDYSLRRGRAEWGTIPESLFIADATSPFLLYQESDPGAPFLFNVITGWEFLEHIAEDKLEILFANMKKHAMPGGMGIFSVHPESYVWEGVEYHQTARPEPWWQERFLEAGMTLRPDLVEHFGGDWVRGWPREISFHIVASFPG